MLPARLVRGNENPQHLRGHPPIHIEIHPLLGRLPNQLAGIDLVNTAEDRVADLHAAPKALDDRMDVESAVDFPAQLSRGLDFGPVQVALEESLATQVHGFDDIVVHQLKPGSSHGCELKTYLPSNRSYADHGASALGEPFRRNDIPLTKVSIQE